MIVKEARQKLAKMMNKDNQVIEEALQGEFNRQVYLIITFDQKGKRENEINIGIC